MNTQISQQENSKSDTIQPQEHQKLATYHQFAFVGALFFLVFGLVNLIIGNTLEAYAEIIIGFTYTYTYFLLKKSNKDSIMIDFSVVILIVFFYLMIRSGGIRGTGILWVALYPIVVFFVRSRRKGTIYVSLLFFMILSTALLQYYGIIQTYYPLHTIIILFFSVLLATILLSLYEKINEKAQLAIEQKNKQIELDKASMDEEIRHRKEAEKDLSQTLLNITQKTQLLEDTKKAMLNLLEDVDEEKNISQARTHDLKKYELAVENASDQIIITNPDAKIIYANQALEKNTGFSKKEVLGETPRVWGRQMDKKFYQNMWKTIKTHKTVFSGEIKNIKKDGSAYIAEVYISPILDSKKNVQFFVAIERDITKAKEIDQAKTEFVSLASHQLRTPLSAINWYTELMLSGDAGKISADQKNYLKEVYDSSKKMSDLVNSLLNVSRIEMGTFVIQPKKKDLVLIAKDVLNELKQLIKQKNIKIIQKYSSPKMLVKIDPNLTRIVFQNLLTNAVKYNKSGGSITVDISTQKKYYMVKVSDTGYGIPKASQDKIFTKLFRAENIKQKVTDGTGLGLYIAKSIIQQSGGQIWFNSIEDKGTTFYVAIPKEGMKQKKGEKTLGS